MTKIYTRLRKPLFVGHGGQSSRAYFFSAIALSLSACGGGGGSGAAPIVAVPTVSVSADKTTIPSGGTVNITWSSTNATACTASGGWTGSKTTSGTQAISGLTQNATFTLTCTGAGGSGNASVSETVTAPAPMPTVSIVATSASVALAATDTLMWSSTNATSCTASGSWSGSQSTSGSTTVGPITTSATYTLNCTGAGGSASSAVNVAVSSQLPPATPIGVLATGVVVLNASTASMLVSSSSTTLTFSGAVPIAPKEIFLLSGSAYIATAVSTVNGQTVVTVAAPTINQVFSKIDLAGTYALDASQVVAQSAAIKEQIKAAHPESSIGVTYPWNYINGPLSVSGNGSLQLQAVPNIHYTSASGFSNTSVEFDASASEQALLTVNAAETLPWTTFANVGNYQIPIPLTVIDGLSNLVGINAAAIYVPLNIGGNVSTPLAVAYSSTVQASGGIVVNVSANGTITGSSTAGLGSNALSFTPPAFSPTSSTPLLTSLGLSAFMGTEIKPQLLLLNTVAVLAVDMKVGPQLSATVDELSSGNPPTLCGSYSGQITLQANAVYTGSQSQSNWPSAGTQNFDLFSIGGMALGGGSCKPQPSVTAAPQSAPVIFVPLAVSVLVTPPTSAPTGAPVPTGQVSISIGDKNCQVTINTSGSGSCTIIPDTGGDQTLDFQYLGNSYYQASALVSQPIQVALAQDTVTLTSTPNPVTVGSTVTFSVAVSPFANNNATKPTGEVDVNDETNQTLCVVHELNSSATGSCSYTYSSPGNHTLTAEYVGDDDYESANSAPLPLAVESVILQIAPASPSVLVGSAVTLMVTATDANGRIDIPPNLEWDTSNQDVATVAAAVVRGVAIGQATITVTDPVSGATASVDVTVNPDVVLTISPVLSSLDVGAKTTLSVSATDGNGNHIATPPNLQWDSLDMEFAIVTNAVVTGVAPGEARITVTDPVSMATASTTVTVSAVDLQISPTPVSLVVGTTTTVMVTASDDSGTIATPPNLGWQPGDPSIATVNGTVVNGVSGATVTGVTFGTTMITVKDPVSLATASTTVTVGLPTVASIGSQVTLTGSGTQTNSGCTNASRDYNTTTPTNIVDVGTPPPFFGLSAYQFLGPINWPGVAITANPFNTIFNVGTYPVVAGVPAKGDHFIYSLSQSGTVFTEQLTADDQYSGPDYGDYQMVETEIIVFKSVYDSSTKVQQITFNYNLSRVGSDNTSGSLDAGCSLQISNVASATASFTYP